MVNVFPFSLRLKLIKSYENFCSEGDTHDVMDAFMSYMFLGCLPITTAHSEGPGNTADFTFLFLEKPSWSKDKAEMEDLFQETFKDAGVDAHAVLNGSSFKEGYFGETPKVRQFHISFNDGTPPKYIFGHTLADALKIFCYSESNLKQTTKSGLWSDFDDSHIRSIIEMPDSLKDKAPEKVGGEALIRGVKQLFSLLKSSESGALDRDDFVPLGEARKDSCEEGNSEQEHGPAAEAS